VRTGSAKAVHWSRSCCSCSGVSWSRCLRRQAAHFGWAAGAIPSSTSASGRSVACRCWSNPRQRLGQVRLGDPARAGDRGYVGEVTPASVGSAALDRGDDLLGEHHVIGITEELEVIAEEPRQVHRNGCRPDRVTEVDGQVHRDPGAGQPRLHMHPDAAVATLLADHLPSGRGRVEDQPVPHHQGLERRRAKSRLCRTLTLRQVRVPGYRRS
jgi:hypothetical protein